MKYFVFFLMFFVISCAKKDQAQEVIEILPIMEDALYNNKSVYYGNFSKFPQIINKLPIGIIDLSGDGNLVLSEIEKTDMADNISGVIRKDGVADLAGENYEIVSDVAHFPYDEYLVDSGKVNLFRELVVKNALFLLGDKFYINSTDKLPLGERDRCKIIVLANDYYGNIATKDIYNLLKLSKIGVKVVGVMEASVSAIFRNIKQNDTIYVALLSNTKGIGAYYRDIVEKKIKKEKFTGKISIVEKDRLDTNCVRTNLAVLLNNHFSINQKPIDYLIIGCREYIPLIDTIKSIIKEYRGIKDINGVNIYENILSNTKLINPMEQVAYECYRQLRDSNNLALNIYKQKINSYISIPSLNMDTVSVSTNFTKFYRIYSDSR